MKQTAISMHLEYKVTLPDHNFPIGTKHQLISSVHPAYLEKDGEVSCNSPTFISIAAWKVPQCGVISAPYFSVFGLNTEISHWIKSGKHDKSCRATHPDSYERVLQLEEFPDAATTRNREVKALVLISVDEGPDEAPKNQQALAVWARQF